MSVRSSMCTAGLVVLLAASAAITAPVQGATPTPYSPAAMVPGTDDVFNQASATAPDGTDIVVWVRDSTPSGYELAARVRRPGQATWTAIPAGIKAQPSLQDVVLESVGTSDFQLAWVRYDGSTPDVLTSRVSSKKRTWSPARSVFTSDDYDYSTPRLAVRPDGAVVIAAAAAPVVVSSPPRIRTVVGVRRPGAAVFTATYLSPVDDFSIPSTVSVGLGGDALVTFLQGYDIGDRKVMAATLRAGGPAPWKVASPLSTPGNPNSVSGAVGASGKAAVVWLDPTYSELRVAAATIGSGTPTWTPRIAATGSGNIQSGRVAVAPDGNITVLWNASAPETSVLTARTLRGSTWTAPVPISDPDLNATSATFSARPDGRIALLYALASYDPIVPQGLRLVLLSSGRPGPITTLTTPAQGAHNQYRLGVDAASRGNVVYTRGAGDPDVAWMGQASAKPAVMTSATSGKALRKAKIKKLPRHRLRCTPGFWVETSKVKYRWLLDGKRVKGAKKPTLNWLAIDPGGQGLQCQVIGVNKAAHKSLKIKSKKVKVG